jgi:Uma2 family endonuclease
MVVSTLVPVAEYLRTSYRPDCDFLEGVILERNVGEYSHSTVQTNTAGLINARGAAWGVRARVELRLNVRSDRYRVPDILVLDRSLPREEIITHPPLLCVEVLSPEDRMSEMDERVNDYLNMGVACVWILDPRRRKAFVRTGPTATEVTGTIRVPGTPIEIPLDDIFAEL